MELIKGLGKRHAVGGGAHQRFGEIKQAVGGWNSSKVCGDKAGCGGVEIIKGPRRYSRLYEVELI